MPVPNFSAADAKFVIESAEFPDHDAGHCDDNSARWNVVEEDPTSLPSYDDRNWLVTTKSGKRVVVKASLIMSVQQVRAQALVMHELSRCGVRVPSVFRLGKCTGKRRREGNDGNDAGEIRVTTNSSGGDGGDDDNDEDGFVWAWYDSSASTTTSVCVIDFVEGSVTWDKSRFRSSPTVAFELGQAVAIMDCVLMMGGDGDAGASSSSSSTATTTTTTTRRCCIADHPAVRSGLTNSQPADGFWVWDTRCATRGVNECLAFLLQKQQQNQSSATTKYSCTLLQYHIYVFSQLVDPLLVHDIRALNQSKSPSSFLTHDNNGVALFSPFQLIHNDINDANVLLKDVTTDGSSSSSSSMMISAILDFGDLCYTHRIMELAHAVAYFLQLAIRDVCPVLLHLDNKQEQLTKDAAAAVTTTTTNAKAAVRTVMDERLVQLVRGYYSEITTTRGVIGGLTDQELRVVLPCALARTCVSIGVGAVSVAERGETISEMDREYLLSNAAPGRTLLRLFAPTGVVPLLAEWEPRLVLEEEVERLVSAVVVKK